MVQVPVELVVAVIGIAVTVLTVYGALIRYLYDGHTTLDQLLRGANGDDGFLDAQRDMNEEMAQTQREIERTMRAHGALLQEMLYVLNNIADEMDEDDIADVDLRRLEHLEETLRADDDIMDHAPDYDKQTED